MVVLAAEDFVDFPPGPFPCDYSPLGEYHAPPLPGYRGRRREGSTHSRWRATPNWPVIPFVEGPAKVLTVDGDGRDDVFVGDGLLGPDGAVSWRRPLRDHAAGVAVGPVRTGRRPPGDRGRRGRRHCVVRRPGHGQHRAHAGGDHRPPAARPAGAAVRHDHLLARAGLVTLYAESCRRLEYQRNHLASHLASHLQPVNWAGDGPAAECGRRRGG